MRCSSGWGLRCDLTLAGTGPLAATAYALLGAGYAALAAATFVGAAVRRRAVGRALDRGGFADVPERAALAMTLVATVLALATLAVILARA